MIERVLVATDLSPACDVAFTHAVRLATAVSGGLRVVHVVAPGRGADERLDAMPRVRDLLGRWRAAGASRLGAVDVVKVVVDADDRVDALLAEVARAAPDLLVLGKHAYHGLGALLHRDVALAVARRARVPAWLFPDGCPGVVRAVDGAVALRRVVVAAARDPSSGPAVALVEQLARGLGVADVRGALVHVGAAAPALPPASPCVRWEALVRPGRDVIGEVDAAVREGAADVVCLTTRGRQSLVDEVVGSMTERLVRAARVPVLVAPAS